MKKFLSILLAVMMVLSTVSFAAPSLAGSDDTAAEAPVVDAPVMEEEPTADLAATAGDKSSYGTLVYSVDFERDDFDVSAFSTAYAQLSANPTAAYMNEDFPLDNTTCYTNAASDGFSNAQLVTDGDNTYITGDVAAGYDGFFRMTKYNQAWPEGYYTFSVDVKAAVGQVSSFAQQCNDTAIALTTLSAFDKANGDWQTVVNQTTNVVNGADMYAFFVTPNNAAAGTVSYDNWEVYYRPATVTLTIEGNEYEVSTDSAVSAATLAGYVTAPTGYILSGLSLTEGGDFLEGEQYFFEDTTLYPTYVKNPYVSDVYGNALFVIDFENEAAQEWWGHSAGDNSNCSYGAWISDVASYYDARFANGVNYRARFIINEGTHIDQATVEGTDGNHYTTAVSVTKWPQISLSNWASVQGEPGIYTFVVDTMTDTAPTGFSGNSAWTQVDGFGGATGVWDRIVLQQEMSAAGNLVSGEPIINYSFAATGATISFDNAALYYKPYTADVTLIYNGEEYLAEDVSTEGVSADTVLAAAGLDVPYGKKAVLSATNGGESIGNVVTLVGDATYYVSFVADDSISEYGKRLFLIDFEDRTVGDEYKTTSKDNLAISNYTSNFNGDWGHLTINWEVGDNVITEEDGNKFIKGQQGWAQVRINNADFANAPAGYYTMALSVMNFGDDSKSLSTKDQNSGTSATWVKAGSVTGTSNSYSIVNGEWNEVASQLDYAGKDFTIYHTAAMTTDVGFDNVALYYRPASVKLTVVDTDGTETVYEDCDSVVDIDTLLADVVAPFGYKAALSVEKNGEPITGSINLVSDAKLYVVLTEDETVSMEYGKALFIIDFENEAAQQWNGCTQEVDNSVDGSGAQVYEVASYYDERFEGKNFRVRFVANEKPWYDQKTVVDENGNHYTSGTNTTKWPQVAQTNWGNVEGKAGYYTYMFDVMSSVAATMTKGSSFDDMPDGFCGEANVWDTVVLTYTMAEDGVLLAPTGGTWANFSFSDVSVATVSYDNAKMYWKPFTATVDLLANGAVAATKTEVATNGVLASTLVDGVKVKGYNITGVKLGTTEYALTDTIVLPGDCDVELVLEVKEGSAATPESSDEVSLRYDDPLGIRFKAAVASSELESITDYGWIIARKDQLAGTELTFDCGVNFVKGYGRQNGVDLKSFFGEDDENKIFTAVLYFSSTEDDGLPSAEKLGTPLVARPFVTVDGETYYGDAVTNSFFDFINDALNENGEFWNSLDTGVQDYYISILDKVDPDVSGVNPYNPAE